MNHLDLTRGVTWIEKHWPNTGEKSWRGWESMADDFAPYTAGAFMETCHVLFRSGLKYAPSPSEVIAAIQPIQARRISSGEDEIERFCDGEHVWSDPLPADIDPVRTCVLCGETRPAGKCAHEHRNRFGVCVYCLDGAAAVPGGEE